MAPRKAGPARAAPELAELLERLEMTAVDFAQLAGACSSDKLSRWRLGKAKAPVEFRLVAGALAILAESKPAQARKLIEQASERYGLKAP